MAILFTEGFDSYGTTAGTNMLTRWATATYATAISSSVTPYGVGQSYGGMVGGTGGASIGIGASTSTFTVGAAIRTGNTNSGLSYPLIAMLSGGTYQVGLTIGSSGEIKVARYTSATAGTLLGSSNNNVILVNNWYYVELSVTISDTVGTVRVDVDGTTVLNLTGVDTRNGTPTTVDTLGLATNNGSSPYVDDIYVTDSITPLGPQRIYTLRPNADTAEKDWVPLSGSDNFAMVDETVIDGDTSYVSASSVGDYDLYELGSYPAATATIKAVNHLVWGRKTDATTRTITSTVKSGATTSDSSAYTLSTSYLGFSRILEADPNTAAAWTINGINALQVGQKVAS